MLRVAMLALGATLTFGALAPQEAAAQASGRERAEAARRGGVIIDGRRDSRVDDRCYDDDRDDRRRYEDRKRDGRYDRNRYPNERTRSRDRYDDRYDRYDCDDDDYRRGKGKGNGPKFCQNGQGHPVHGMSWCREKGWGRGYSMRNVGWGDVILRRPREVAQRDLGRGVLQDILGRAVYGRFDQQRNRLGLDAPMTGNWSNTSRGYLLNLFSGGVHVAEILDRNRDGRADVILLAYDR